MSGWIDLDGRVFRSTANSQTGEVSAETSFRYRQSGELVSATYEGGAIRQGHLIGVVLDDGTLDARYQHVNADGALMTGRCRTTPERLADGRIRLHERWQWTSGDGSRGESVVEEVRRPVSG